MIRRALQLRFQIKYFCLRYRSKTDKDGGLIEAQILIDQDWYILSELTQGLDKFETAIKSLEGLAETLEFGVIWEAIPVMEDLLLDLKDL